MAITYRSLQKEEFTAWCHLCAKCFVGAATFEYFKAHFELDINARVEDIFVAVDDNQLVASARLFRRQVRFGEDIFAMGGIGEVCTLETYRGQGLANKLLTMVISRMKELNFSLSYLGAAIGSYYERFGYTRLYYPYVSYIPKSVIDTHAYRKVELPEDLADIKQIYKRNQFQIIGHETRLEDGYWTNWVSNEFRNCYVGVNKEGKIISYCSYKISHDALVVNEIGGDNLAEILSFIRSINPSFETIDAPAFCQADLKIAKEYLRNGRMVQLINTINVSKTIISSTTQLSEFLVANRFMYWLTDNFIKHFKFE